MRKEMSFVVGLVIFIGILFTSGCKSCSCNSDKGMEVSIYGNEYEFGIISPEHLKVQNFDYVIGYGGDEGFGECNIQWFMGDNFEFKQSEDHIEGQDCYKVPEVVLSSEKILEFRRIVGSPLLIGNVDSGENNINFKFVFLSGNKGDVIFASFNPDDELVYGTGCVFPGLFEFLVDNDILILGR